MRSPQDVQTCDGPTHIIEDEHEQRADIDARGDPEIRYPDGIPSQWFRSGQRFACEHPLIVPAGSVLFYDLALLHRGSRMRRGGSRMVTWLTYRPAGAPWIGQDVWNGPAARLLKTPSNGRWCSTFPSANGACRSTR